ncbi:MAG TPA: hypothetical protein VK190_04480 [Pseudoneobacillus sp.]|nr:hypothetical protein [Pseudoneobacillus sp.]
MSVSKINSTSVPSSVNTGQSFTVQVDASFSETVWDDLDLTNFNYVDTTETAIWQELDRKVDNIRYIKDWISGSTANVYNHWVEVQAFDSLGTNVALNKTVTFNGATFTNSTRVTDGDLTSANYVSVGGGTGLQSITVDLGSGFSLSSLKIWHYYADGRTYHSSMTEVSADGINWYRVFDSRIEGEYVEISSGHEIIL